MSWFGAFRNHYDFTSYGEKRTAVTFDFPLVAVTYLCVVVGVATLISALGIRGRERWATSLRACYSVGIASIILVCLVGHNWLVGDAAVDSTYLYRSDHHFRGTVGVRIALHSCNVTLEGRFKGANGDGEVYYAESMQWKDYGREQETISHYLQRGLPHPVLTVMDFLSMDAGGMRWGRSYHAAGYFGCALLWTAFVFWIISNVLLLSVVCYGAFMFFLTGVAMVLSCVVYHVCQPPHELRISFGTEHELVTRYGWCYWLTLSAGIVTLVLGALLFVCDNLFHKQVSEFFNLDNLDEDDTFELTNNDSTLKAFPVSNGGSFTGKASGLGGFHGRSGSLQQTSGPRRGSIFLEPGRRPSDFSSGRKGSMFTTFSSGILLGVGQGQTNRGFEQERTAKSNPLFGTLSADIHEEAEEKLTQVRVEVPGGTPEGDRKTYVNGHAPPLTSTKERHENHVNERFQQQQQQQGKGSAHTTVVITCPSDDEAAEDDVTRTQPPDVALVMTTDVHDDELHEGQSPDRCTDSAFASGSSSPPDSEKNSTCGDMEGDAL